MQNLSDLHLLTNFALFNLHSILGDPEAVSLFEGQKSPWELTLTERVPEIFESVPLIGQKNDFSGQSAKRSSRGTLSPSYTMWFSSSIGVILVESFRKRCKEAEEMANRTMGARKQYSSINFHETFHDVQISVAWAMQLG